jgi:hypothetical protein
MSAGKLRRARIVAAVALAVAAAPGPCAADDDELGSFLWRSAVP